MSPAEIADYLMGRNKMRYMTMHISCDVKECTNKMSKVIPTPKGEKEAEEWFEVQSRKIEGRERSMCLKCFSKIFQFKGDEHN